MKLDVTGWLNKVHIGSNCFYDNYISETTIDERNTLLAVGVAARLDIVSAARMLCVYHTMNNHHEYRTELFL